MKNFKTEEKELQNFGKIQMLRLSIKNLTLHSILYLQKKIINLNFNNTEYKVDLPGNVNTTEETDPTENE